MRKTWNWKFAIKIAAAIMPGLIAALMPIDFWHAWTAPEAYPFDAAGPAAAMWAYQSQAHYLVSVAALWASSVLALCALFATRHGWRLRWLCAMPFLAVWAFWVLDGSRLA